MTSGIPRRPAQGQSRPERTAPLAWISLAALELNLRAVLSTAVTGVIDVRADAWGHGADIVAPIALRAGADALLVDEAASGALGDIVDPTCLVFDGTSLAPDAVYGLSAGFAAVMSLQGWILSLKRLRAGEGVSYGYTHRATHDTTVALVTGGYAQGVVRSLGDAASVLINGHRHPIVGRVAMDVCVVDIGVAAAARGDAVTFFGDPAAQSPQLSEWTAATGMSAAELVTAVGLRNAREYVG